MWLRLHTVQHSSSHTINYSVRHNHKQYHHHQEQQQQKQSTDCFCRQPIVDG
jgi:hypothetical protein